MKTNNNPNNPNNPTQTQPIRIKRFAAAATSHNNNNNRPYADVGGGGRGLLSQSLGAYAPGRGHNNIAAVGGGGGSHRRFHRHLSDVSTISYSGYLLKRSNKPQDQYNNPNNFTPFPSAADFPDTMTTIDSSSPNRLGYQPQTCFPPLPQLEPKFARMEDYVNADYASLSNSQVDAPPHQPQHIAIQPQQQSALLDTAQQHLQQPQPKQMLTSSSEESKLCEDMDLNRIQHNESSSSCSLDSAYESTAAFASSFFGVDLKLLGKSLAKTNSKKKIGDRIEAQSTMSSQTGAQDQPNHNPLQFQGRDEENRGSFTEKLRASVPTLSSANMSKNHVYNRSNSDCSHPSDVVDADGHTWRAKYCVLENGILYFYRYRTDAEAPEAHLERQHHHATYDLDAAAGTESNGSSAASFQSPSLAMSPIPRAHYFAMAGSVGGTSQSSVGGGMGASSDHSLHMWEKFVALNAVGAVRSAESVFGENSFELSAADDFSEKLILRARNQDEMNEWLFQFHRSIASYVADIMECASSVTKVMDIHHPTFSSHRPMAPIATSPSDRNNVVSMTAFSPRFAHALTPLVMGIGTPTAAHQFGSTPVLSHGHGRNSLHRRRMDFSGGSIGSRAPLFPNSNSQTPSQRNQLTLLSRTDSKTDSESSPVPQPFPFMPQPHDSPSGQSGGSMNNNNNNNNINSNLIRRLVTPTPREQMRLMEDISPELSAPVSNYPETERPLPTIKKGKYVPPHMRNRQEKADVTAGGSATTVSAPTPDGSCVSSSSGGTAAKKYVPPHLRGAGGSAKPPPANTPPRKYVPPQMRTAGPTIPNNEGVGILLPRHEFGETNFHEEAKEEGGRVVSEMYFDEMEHFPTDEDGTPVRLGGCADPNLVHGSIMDDRYIPRKASKLGKTPPSSFGTTCNRNPEPANGSVLQWEVGAVSECGVRDSNEDAFVIASDLIAAFDDLIAASIPSSQTVWESGTSIHAPSLFAVFDGHCGDHAARFASEGLIRFIHEQSIMHDALDIDLSSPSGLDRVQEIMRRAVLNLDKEFCNLCVHQGRDWESGATALIATLVNEHLVIANLGDARGVMSRSVGDDDKAASLIGSGWNELPSKDCNGSSRRCFYKQVSEPHSPAREDEKARIEKANGWITTEKEIPIGQLQRMALFDQDVLDILMRCIGDRSHGPSPKAAAPQRILQISRVCGELAVSRAIGDRDFKAAFNSQRTALAESNENFLPEWGSSLFLPYPEDHSRSFFGDLVSNQPEFQSIKVGEPGVQDEFLLLACDGLWDVMDPDDAVRLTRTLLFEKSWSAKDAASRLAELAVHLGSSDNITVIVVRFCNRAR